MKLILLLTTGVLAVSLAACGAQATPEAASPAPPTTEAAAVAPTATEKSPPATEEAASAAKPPAAAPQEAKPLVLSDEVKKAFPADQMTTTDSGLQYLIEEKGAGEIPAAGSVVQVHYKGRLADGTVFDSSYERNEPIAFPLGKGAVILGWDEGIGLLPVGSKAKLTIPPNLAYGEAGAGGVIPPNATLYFEVELVDVLPPSPKSPTEVKEADYTTTASGLKYYDLKEGDGATPKAGQMVKIHYTGWLEDGTKFDSSLDMGKPYLFPISQKAVMEGWDEGISTMKVGGKRQMIIPAKLGLGEKGAGNVIPPNATLIFEVELLEVLS